MIRMMCTVFVTASLALAHGQAFGSEPVVPDITVSVLGTTVTDDEALDEYPAGVPQVADLGGLPDAAEVDAYWVDADGEHLFSLDSTIELAGGVTARPADVVRWDGFNYSIEFDAAGFGIVDGVNVDAVMEWMGSLVFSFDTSVDLGGGAVAADEDLVIVSGASLVVFLDASVAGVPESLDLDAASISPTSGGLLLSFDQAGSVGGVAFDDDTVLEYAPPNWSIAFDASSSYVGFEAADVVAVPEPGALALLVAGCGLLASLARRRIART